MSLWSNLPFGLNIFILMQILWTVSCAARNTEINDILRAIHSDSSSVPIKPFVQLPYSVDIKAKVSWTPLSRKMNQVDTGLTPYVWATDSNQDVYYLNGSNFEQVPGKLAHVSSGGAGVWGVSAENKIFFRDEVNPGNPKGSGWIIVKGGLKRIDSGPKGIVCGVTTSSKVFCRAGITKALPTGTKWQRISGRFEYISCGSYGCWGVNKYNRVYFTSAMNGVATKWTRVGCDAMIQIEAGPHGEVWAVNTNNKLYKRTRVSQSVPSGLSWEKVETVSFKLVTIGQSNLYAVDLSNTFYAGSIFYEKLPEFRVGKLGPSLPSSGYILMNTKIAQCLAPDSQRPREGTEVIHTLRCRDSRALWKVLPNGAIQHVQSTLCIHLSANTECPRKRDVAILKQDCSNSRYFFKYTEKRFQLKQTCLGPRNEKRPDGTSVLKVVLHSPCNKPETTYEIVDIIKGCDLQCLKDIKSSKESTNSFANFFKKSEAEAELLVPDSSAFISTLKQEVPELFKDLFSTFFPIDPQVITNLEILVNHFGMEKAKDYPSLFLATAFIRRKIGVNASEPAVCGGTGHTIAGVPSIDEEDAENKLSLSESELATFLDDEDYKAQQAIDQEIENDQKAGINTNEFKVSAVQKLLDHLAGKYYHRFWTPKSLEVSMKFCGMNSLSEIKFPPRGDGMSGIEYLEYYFSRDPQLLPPENLKFPWPLAISLNIQTSLRQCNWIWRRLENGQRIVRYSRYSFDYQLKQVQCKASDWNPCAIPRIIKDGGVCGRQSTLARVTNHCLGIASGGIKQPGHAAGFNYIKSNGGYTFKIFQGITSIMNTYAVWHLIDDAVRPAQKLNAEYHRGLANAMNYGYESYRDGRISLLIFSRIYDADLRHNSRDLLVEALEGNPHMMDVWMKLIHDVTGSNDLPIEAKNILERIPAKCPGDFDDSLRNRLLNLIKKHLNTYMQMYVEVLLRLISPPPCCSLEQPKYLDTLRLAWSNEQREIVKEYLFDGYVSCASKSASIREIVGIIKQDILSKAEIIEVNVLKDLLRTLQSIPTSRKEIKVHEKNILIDFFLTVCDAFPRFHITASAWAIAHHYRACMEAQIDFLQTYASDLFKIAFEEWKNLQDDSAKPTKIWNEYHLKGWLYGRAGDIVPLLVGVKESVDGALLREIKANIAKHKPTTMSSTRNADTSSEKAVDGNTDNLVSGASCAVTTKQNNPWFQLDLQDSTKVHGLLISNADDKVVNRFRSFEIHIGDSLDDHGQHNPSCGYLHSLPRGGTRAFYCDPPLVGRYITINIPRSTSSVLAICEIAVYDSKLASYRTNGVKLDIWYHVPSSDIHRLYNDHRYPDNPDFTSRLSTFDYSKRGDDYGSLLSAEYQPLETGNYTFYVACTDQCEVFLRPGENSATLDKIISLKKATHYQDWNVSADQQSLPIFLEKNKFYELKATLKENRGNDYITLAVKLPSGKFLAPIPSDRLFIDTKEESMQVIT